MFDPFGDFAKGFGTNRAELVEQLALVLPELQRANADVAPHLLAAAVVHQVSTNGPIIAEFAQSLAASTAAMERLVNPKRYFALVSGPVLWWGVDHKQYALITNVLATTERAAAGGYAEKLEDYKKLNLAFAYCALENWQAALDIFQSYSNRPVYVGSRGLWEGAFSTISTSLYTARCREKLGLPVTKDPRQFEMGKSCLCLHDPAYSRQWNAYWVESALFAAEATGLWVAGEGQLVNLDFNLHTNQTIELPASSLASSLSLAKDTIWIGTSDAGLIEYNRVANKCHAITEADGLLMNAISQLYATGDKLWIAYGDRQGRGGLGVMDLRTRKLSSFTRSLGQDPASLRSNSHNQGDEPADRPPRQKLNALLVWKDESWFIPQSVWSHHLRRFRVRENLWDGFAEPGHCSSLLVGEDELYVAQNEYGRKDLTGLGVAVRNLRNGAWRRLALADNLVGGTISAMTLDGKDLWVGGLGFIARLDRESGQTRAFSYVSAASVDHLEIAGGCLWAKFDKHLYRATLKDIPL